MIGKSIKITALVLCLSFALCGCVFDKTATKSDISTESTATESLKKAESDISTLPNTIDTYAKNYTEVGEVFPTKSLGIDSEVQKEVVKTESAKKGMSTYASEFGYTIEYPEEYMPKGNFDGKEFIIIDENSGSNMNVIITYPNIIYESEEQYRKAIDGNDEIRLKSFEVTEINGVNAVQLELAVAGGHAYQTIFRTGEYYYVLSYVQSRGVTRVFDEDMKAVINSFKLK